MTRPTHATRTGGKRTRGRPARSTRPGGRRELSAAELKRYGQRLRTLRQHLMDEIARLQGLPLGEPGSRLDPDVEWDQMMAVRSMDDKRAILRQIDQALARIEDKTFGLCVVDSHPIPPDKLAEMPWVKHCEHCAIRPTAGAPRDAFDVNPRMSAENPQPRTDPNAPDPPA